MGVLSFLSCPLPDLEPCFPSQLGWCICLSLCFFLPQLSHLSPPTTQIPWVGPGKGEGSKDSRLKWSYPSTCSGNHRTLYPHFLHIALCGWKTQPGHLSGKDSSDCIVAPEPRRCYPGDQAEYIWTSPVTCHPSH